MSIPPVLPNPCHVARTAVTQSGIDTRKIGSFGLYLFVSPDYIAKRGPVTGPQDLAVHDCLALRTYAPRIDWPLTWQGSTVNIEITPRMFDPVEVPLRPSVPRHVKEYGVHRESSSMPKISLAGRVSFSPSKPQAPICGRGVPQTCGIRRPWRRNRAERVQVIRPIPHCVFRRGLAYEAVVGADHADRDHDRHRRSCRRCLRR
jgi:hypothetical protein